VRALDILQRKRDGLELSRGEIRAFVDGYGSGEVPDYQASAFTMAIYFRGMSRDETVALTEAMLDSGARLDLDGLTGPKVDKHSTGGVGDKASLVLAPLAAACGVLVPMISGRALGHTGGTLDKLEAIPGFRVRLSLSELRKVLTRCGLVLVGQTHEIAPVDRKLYALRDVTATVESVPLIAASIMSKKLSEGLDGLVLDVKFGDGAFMPDVERARELAQTMIDIGHGLGCRVQALITGMDQPLGRAVGNALEVAEAIDTLKGRGPRDVESLSVELAARMIVLAGLKPSVEQARARVREALASGAGLAKLRQVIEAQGGDPRVCDDPGRLPRAGQVLMIRAPHDGRVTRIACRTLGRAATVLGAGRDTLLTRVQPAAGIVLHKKVGELVIEKEPLLSLHSDDPERMEAARSLLSGAMVIGREAPALTPLVRAVLEQPN
jgi:pyrimidine-nucleoside phosphorylase/thymidine phosphorylase